MKIEIGDNLTEVLKRIGGYFKGMDWWWWFLIAAILFGWF